MTEPKTEHDWVSPTAAADLPPGKMDEIGLAFRKQHVEAIKSFFTYHPPTPEQQKKYVEIRELALEFALRIEDLMPSGDDKKKAIDRLRETVMLINQGIACDGMDYRV